MEAQPAQQHATGLQPLTVLHNSLLPRPGHTPQLAVLTHSHTVQLLAWEGGGQAPVRLGMRLLYGSGDAVCCAAWCDWAPALLLQTNAK